MHTGTHFFQILYPLPLGGSSTTCSFLFPPLLKRFSKPSAARKKKKKDSSSMKWENPRLFANAVLPGKPKRATRPSHMFVYLLHNSAQGCFRNIQEWKVSCLFSLTFVTAVLPSDSKVLKNKPGASALVLADAQRKSLTTERSGSYNHHEVWPHGLQMRQHCFWFREKSRYCHETSAARRQGSRELQPNSAGLFL